MPEIRIEHGVTETGEPRPGLLVAFVDDQIVGSAARAYNSDEWVAFRRDRNHYALHLSEIGARELLTEWAQEMAGDE